MQQAIFSPLKRIRLHEEIRGAIHSTKIQTGPTEKRGPPQKVDSFFRNFCGWTEPIHWVLDRNFRKVWLNGSRPRKAWHEECSRFCWKIWCSRKNLTSKQKQRERKRITSLKQTTKEKKTTTFFSKRGRVQYKIKYRRAVHRMSLETFQMAQRIILKVSIR